MNVLLFSVFSRECQQTVIALLERANLQAVYQPITVRVAANVNHGAFPHREHDAVSRPSAELNSKPGDVAHLRSDVGL